MKSVLLFQHNSQEVWDGSNRDSQINAQGTELATIHQSHVGEFLKLKVVLEGYRRCQDSHDLSECHHLSPSYKFNIVNFDSEKLSAETLWDHPKYSHHSM